MILIADSGSSKTDWRLIDGVEIQQFKCKGLNPDFNTEGDVSQEISTVFNKRLALKVKEIYFYGSGCSSPQRQSLVENGMRQVFTAASIQVEHDLLGAARAACRKEPGLAGILGTGSNCCLFDGEYIKKSYRSGGYIIGDEGGGVDIGKKVLKSFIEDDLPTDLKGSFETRYQLSVDDLLRSIYKGEQPNRFIASFAKFAFHHREHSFITNILLNVFRSYFSNQVLRYPEAKESPLNLVGSVAFYYQEYIKDVAQEVGVRIGTIIEKPISGLTLYHSESLSN